MDLLLSREPSMGDDNGGNAIEAPGGDDIDAHSSAPGPAPVGNRSAGSGVRRA